MAENTHTPPPPLAPPPPPPSSSRVSSGTIERAVQALLKWKDANSKTQKASLLEPDDFVYLILTLKKIPANARTNPFKIPLPHPLIDPATAEICLIIDDRPKSGITKDAAQKKIKSEGVPVAKVLKLSKLRTNYRPFEAKRKLCDSYDMFLADRRVVGMLPRLLGKQFFKKKKIPVGVDLRHKSWKEQVERVCASALLFVGTGTCSVLKVGRVCMGKEEIVANVAAALEGVAEVVPRKWRNVRSFHLKLMDSLALPVYQALPDVKLKIEGLKDKEVEKEEEEGVNEVVEEGKGSESAAKKKGAKKGRIHEVRYMDTNLHSLMDEDDEDVHDLDMVEVEESDDDDKDETDGSKTKGKKGKLKKGRDVYELSGGKISKKLAKSKKEGEKKTKTTLSGDSKNGDSVKKTKKSNLTVKEGEVSEGKKERKRKIKV
ncbi:putative ribosome biogenesis protein C8F11.04 [Rhodamnia argentea]|uniref:Ribosome biogenesis protein C8F11.04 n=1 Tax=Rhodamnia argentea TaxID=178133 RepID=A0A8B8NAP9_9MYRT|nr:putative ribosome biogenesis protein C8F11.04 [Rhodamnia argentea]